MKKNNYIKYSILSVLIFLGHFCFSQVLLDEPFSMVHLNKDSTHIVLQDYFPNVKETAYRITHEPAGMDVRILDNYEVILYGEPSNIVDYLGISVDFIERAIPITKFNSNNSIERNFITSQSYNSKGELEIYRSYPATKLTAFINNRPVDENLFTYLGQKVLIKIPTYASNLSTSNLRIYGNDFNQPTNDIWIPLSYGIPIIDAEVLTPYDYHSNIMYSMIVDRFKNGDKLNDNPINSLEVPKENDWYGGDFKGIIHLQNTDYFKQMGYNTLIISPVFKNTEKLNNIIDESISSQYLGNSPISWSKIENRLGDKEDLQTLIGKAHLKKMNVLLGNVANVLPNDNPLVKNVPNYSDSLNLKKQEANYCQNINIDLDNPTISRALIDSLTKVFNTYPIDGFAHIKSSSTPAKFWHKLSNNIMQKIGVPQRRKFFQLSQSSVENYYIGTNKLNSMLDHDLFIASTSVFFKEKGHKELQELLATRMNQFGSHHLLANITGSVNQQRIRNLAAKNLNAELNNTYNKELSLWEKLKQFLVFNNTIPGIPVTYYGDEIGLEDNRLNSHSLMRFKDLSIEEKHFRNFVAKLNKLRRQEMALMYGEIEILKATKESLIFTRSYLNNKIIIAINTSNEPQLFELELPDYMKDKIFSGNYFTPVEKAYRKIIFTLPPNGFEIFISR